MLKLQSKQRKASGIKAAHVVAAKQAQPVIAKPKPAWDDCSSNLDRYKLSQAELVNPLLLEWVAELYIDPEEGLLDVKESHWS